MSLKYADSISVPGGGAGTVVFPTLDWTGIVGYTETGMDAAIAKRDATIDQLNGALTDLTTALGTLGSMPAFTGALDPAALGAMPAPMQVFPLPVAPSFATNFPSAPTIGTVTFDYTESAYTSNLLGNLESLLLNLLSNIAQTGLSDAVLDAQWNVDREKTAGITAGQILGIQREYQAANWDIPPGDELSFVIEARQQAVQGLLGSSRNIVVANAELVQKNFQFTVAQGIALETQNQTFFTATQSRLLEVAKTTVDSLLRIIESQITVYGKEIDAESTRVNALVSIFQAEVNVYSTEIQAEATRIKSSIDVLLAQLEYYSKKIGVDIDVYKTNLQLFINQKELSLKTLESITSLLAQVAASIGGAVDYHTSIGASTSLANTPFSVMTV
jgi:hypothetical protein